MEIQINPKLWKRFESACKESGTTPDAVIEQLAGAWTDAQEVGVPQLVEH